MDKEFDNYVIVLSLFEGEALQGFVTTAENLHSIYKKRMVKYDTDSLDAGALMDTMDSLVDSNIIRKENDRYHITENARTYIDFMADKYFNESLQMIQETGKAEI